MPQIVRIEDSMNGVSQTFILPFIFCRLCWIFHPIKSSKVKIAKKKWEQRKPGKEVWEDLGVLAEEAVQVDRDEVGRPHLFFLLASIWRRLLNIGQVETLKALLVDDDQGFDLQEFLLSVQAFVANKPSGDGIFKFLCESLKAPAGIVPARFSSRLHMHIP